MTTATGSNQGRGAGWGIDVRKITRDYRSVILRITVAVTAVAIVAGAWYYLWGQTSRATVTQQFRPVFSGAPNGRYPNGLPYSSSDITAAAVLDQVFDRNGLKDYCDRAQFRSAFFVEQRSPAYAFLEAEYQSKLAEVRITAVERERLQAEYQAKRSALPLQHRLVYVNPTSCQAMPAVVMKKAVSDALTVWADDSESKRGVLNLQINVLSPNVLDAGDDSESLMIRADLILGALRHLANNIAAVELLPGAGLVRSPEKLSFMEVRVKLEDLIHSRLEPAVISMSGSRDMGDSITWIQEALSSATREELNANGRAQAYMEALQVYSGGSNQAPGTRPDSRQTPTGSSDVQTLAPQIDRTFIDRIIELSSPNMLFRQEMTRSMVEARVEAIRQQGNRIRYQHLLDAVRRPGGSVTRSDIAARLKSIVDTGKALAKQFNDLYAEFSRVSLRASASLYQVEGPIEQSVIRGYSFRDYVLTVIAALLLTLLASFAGAVAWSRLKAAPSAGR